MDDDSNPISQSPWSRGDGIPTAVQLVFRWGFVLAVATALVYIVVAVVSDDNDDDGVDSSAPAAESGSGSDDGSAGADSTGEGSLGGDADTAATDPSQDESQIGDIDPTEDPAASSSSATTTTAPVEAAPVPPPPQAASGLDGSYVALLAAYTVESAARDELAVLEGRYGRDFEVLASSDFASLNPGLFVVYAGPFSTSQEAQSACWNLDRRTSDLCYGRRLSQNPADGETAYPPAPGQGAAPVPPPPAQAASGLDGSYVALLAAYTVEGAARDELAVLEGRYGQDFEVLASSDFASLNPGLFVVYAGPFSTSQEAQSACWNLDRRTSDLCYGRRLSQNPADGETAYPPAPPS